MKTLSYSLINRMMEHRVKANATTKSFDGN